MSHKNETIDHYDSHDLCNVLQRKGCIEKAMVLCWPVKEFKAFCKQT